MCHVIYLPPPKKYILFFIYSNFVSSLLFSSNVVKTLALLKITMGNGTYIAVCIFFSGRIFYMYFIDYAIAGVPSPPFIPLLTEHPLPLAFPLP